MSVPTQQWAQRDDVHEQMADMLMAIGSARRFGPTLSCRLQITSPTVR